MLLINFMGDDFLMVLADGVAFYGCLDIVLHFMVVLKVFVRKSKS